MSHCHSPDMLRRSCHVDEIASTLRRQRGCGRPGHVTCWPRRVSSAAAVVGRREMSHCHSPDMLRRSCHVDEIASTLRRQPPFPPPPPVPPIAAGARPSRCPLPLPPVPPLPPWCRRRQHHRLPGALRLGVAAAVPTTAAGAAHRRRCPPEPVPTAVAAGATLAARPTIHLVAAKQCLTGSPSRRWLPTARPGGGRWRGWVLGVLLPSSGRWSVVAGPADHTPGGGEAVLNGFAVASVATNGAARWWAVAP